MENISLNNGQLVTIASNKDMFEIIEENLSYELAKYISEILWNQEEIDGYNKWQFQTDYKGLMK